MGYNNIINCPECGKEISDRAPQCPYCGFVQVPPPSDETFETIVPYKNIPALASYYLGIFSLIPCMGIILGILSIIFGFYGLKIVKENPKAHGTAHAWVGIILGTIVVIANLGVILFLLLSKGK